MELFPKPGWVDRDISRKHFFRFKCRGNRPLYDHQEVWLLAGTDKLPGMCSGGATAHMRKRITRNDRYFRKAVTVCILIKQCHYNIHQWTKKTVLIYWISFRADKFSGICGNIKINCSAFDCSEHNVIFEQCILFYVMQRIQSYHHSLYLHCCPVEQVYHCCPANYPNPAALCFRLGPTSHSTH